MDITITPSALQGNIQAIPSKSVAHRLLILAAFADNPTDINCPTISRDIKATIGCIKALGGEIIKKSECFTVFPIKHAAQKVCMVCGESGSTLRFFLPVVGALGIDGTFLTEGRLAQRPLSPLWEEMERMGCTLSRPDERSIRCTGKLNPGHYRISGDVSSQFITGLMLALSILKDESTIEITGVLQSKPYLDITRDAIRLFDGDPDAPGSRPLRSPRSVSVEGDWSSAAFFLSAAAMGSHVSVSGLNPDSPQGDRAVTGILTELDKGCPTVSAADIPDLIPVLSVVAAAKHGAVFTDIQRLRLKESDRVASVLSMLTAFGIRAEADCSSLRVLPGTFQGAVIDSANDHRIAMSAAIAATVATGKVTVLNAECVNKSYPRFWEDYRYLGGQYEFSLR